MLDRARRAIVHAHMAITEWRDRHQQLLRLLWAIYIGAFCVALMVSPTPRMLAIGIALAVVGQLEITRLLRAIRRDMPRAPSLVIAGCKTGITFHQNGGEAYTSDLARHVEEQLHQAIERAKGGDDGKA